MVLCDLLRGLGKLTHCVTQQGDRGSDPVVLCVHVLSASVPAGKADHYLRSEVPRIIDFANSIVRDQALDDTVVRNCVNVLGDVCTVIPNIGGAFSASSKQWESLIVYCQDSGHLLGDTEWAITAVRTAIASAGSS